MTDIIENILSTKQTYRVLTPIQVPLNCAAGRCGHKKITIPTIAFTKDTVLNVMDEYAIKILQWVISTKLDIDLLPVTASELLNSFKEEIKKELNEKDK